MYMYKKYTNEYHHSLLSWQRPHNYRPQVHLKYAH